MGKKKKTSGKWNLKKILLVAGFVVLVICLVVGFIYYKTNLEANFFVQGDTHKYLLIDRDDTFDDVVVKLQETGTVKNIQSFIRTAKNNGYPESMVPGRYELEDGMSNYMLVHRLINGRQTPLRITFNNIRTKEVLAQRLSKQMMMDSLEMINALNNDTLLSRYGLTRPTAVALFIPNTYEVYWDISPEKLMDKMKVEYDKFWTEERLQKLNDVGLTQLEVSTLASIVDEETNKKDEKPLIAGLYLNRLNKGMPLQADPTVKFAVQDFSLRRIYSGHLETDSPYNTYKHAGLPPGPIRIPSTEGIDAVLNYVDHDYMYMCAREDRSGYHNFATTFEEHLKNASKYRNTLNQRGVQ
ncbi:MAG TPA: endolytic transglycosylase MltG [Paludibacteraceae bacterium]|nr:endolytic transglycosylase MltG [Paludibacteraceae bacterium]HQF50959.1 endolytic transglycosylase MltG [Paludibacteraceae bacterium]